MPRFNLTNSIDSINKFVKATELYKKYTAELIKLQLELNS